MSPLHEACMKGDLQAVEALLAQRVQLETYALYRPAQQQPEHWKAATPLIIAGGEGHVHVVQRLLAGGACIEAADPRDRTALHWAARHAHESVVDALLTSGACVGALTGSNCTPLHMAAWGGSASVVRRLLIAGADVNACDHARCTPLIRACFSGHATAARALLEGGADLHARNTWGQTPLSISLKSGQPPELLLELILAGEQLCGKAACAAAASIARTLHQRLQWADEEARGLESTQPMLQQAVVEAATAMSARAAQLVEAEAVLTQRLQRVAALEAGVQDSSSEQLASSLRAPADGTGL